MTVSSMCHSVKSAGLIAAVAWVWLAGASASAQKQTIASLQNSTSKPKVLTYAESVLVNFTGTAAPDYGASPETSLIQASDGNFYGTAQSGTTFSNAFRLMPEGGFKQLFGFPKPTDFPSALIEAPNGNFYGTTPYGGTSDLGTIFELTPDGTEIILHSFSDGSDQEDPRTSLILGTDGNLYGTAEGNGSSTFGTVFKISPDSPNTMTILHTFEGGTNDGQGPTGLVQGSDGNFYGTTAYGGGQGCEDDIGCGTVFKVSADGSAYSLVYTFPSSELDGGVPLTGLVEGSDGYFYGTTTEGGELCENSADCGTIFKIYPDGSTFIVLHSFDGSSGDGVFPTGSLLLGSDGNLYGTTFAGGNSVGNGVVFGISTEGTNYTLLTSFADRTTDGGDPYGGLVQGLNGNFYGTTYLGGADADGVIFELTVSPALAPPVQLTIPSGVQAGSSFTLAYAVGNAYSETMQQCFATNTAGDTTGWVGIKIGSASATNATLTASATPGTYIYTLTCGGVETGIATLSVTPNSTADITFTSVTHDMGSVKVGSSTSGSSNYGVKVTNTSGASLSAKGISLTGSNEFKYQTNCPATLAAGAHCEILFTFAPTATGTIKATWSLTGLPDGTAYRPSNGGTLTGTGTSTGAVTLTTNGHNFGTVAVGDAAATYGTELVNSTESAVTLSLGPVTSPFSVLTNCMTTLAANHSCELEFNFKPSAAGIVQQVYSLTAAAGGTPVTITTGGVPSTGIKLTGTGE